MYEEPMKKIPLGVFLHFYQPQNQQKDILQRIVFESYYPILKIFERNEAARATFNFPAGLIQLLQEKKYLDIISQLEKLVKRGQIELTGTAAYHAFLPLLPVPEIKRQILLNEETLKKIFGEAYKRNGFFSPELAFSYKIARIITQLGFSWMAVPMISFGQETPDFTTLYKLNKYNLYLFPRHKWASSVILSGVVRSEESLLDWVKNDRPVVASTSVSEEVGYYTLIMDGETFGHHRPGLENLLEELGKSKRFELLQVSDLFKKIKSIKEVSLREASWSNEEQDFWLDKERKIAAKNPFLLWKDPANPIHKLQWQLTTLAIRTVRNSEFRISNYELRSKIRNTKYKILNTKYRHWLKARNMLDKALGSDQYWWASAKPWWSLEMIEAGAWDLVNVVKTISSKKSTEVLEAEKIYRKILDIAFFWQRTGFIRKKHRQLQGSWAATPFKKRTPAEWYNQIILEFEDEMKKAAENLEFEKAIKWRDAIYKLHTGADVFDILHVVNELHAVRKIPSLKPFLLHKKSEISKFARNYLQNLTEEEIATGKRNLAKQGFKI